LTPMKPVGEDVDESRHDGCRSAAETAEGNHVGFWDEVAWIERSKSPSPGRRKLQP
jgi:hypothetical protein